MRYDEVVVECGYNTEAAARKAVGRLMVRANVDAVQEAKAIHRVRIEALLQTLWLAAVNPGMAQKAARTAANPQPPDQGRAIELLHKLLDQLAKVEGTYAPVHAEMTGPAGGPIEGRIDVVHWRPDELFMTQYARVLKEAGLLDDDDEREVKLVGPGAGDPELAS